MPSAAVLHVKRITFGDTADVVIWNAGGLPATEIAADLLGGRASVEVVAWAEPPEPFDLIGEYTVATITYNANSDPEDDACVIFELRWNGGERTHLRLWPVEDDDHSVRE